MARKVVVDPVTRIEGKLRIEVEVDGGVVVDAKSSGTMARGFEVLLQGKDPRDATYVTERVCGVCAGAHGWTSSIALENAFGAKIPEAARVLRNLIIGAMWLHDHPLHFYHLSALDYIDVMAVARYSGNDPALNAVKSKIVGLVETRDTAPLTPRYRPDEYSISDPEIVTTAVAHYIKALEMQSKAKKMSAVWGGKQPHQSSIVFGGVTMPPTVERIAEFRSMLSEQYDFIKNVYVPDVLAIGTGPLLPLARSGLGGGRGNFLSYGAFPLNEGATEMFLKPGVILDGNLDVVKEVDVEKITESVKYSWYTAGTATVHPRAGKTEYDLNKKDAYSFVKAPRYDGKPMEVGSLARMLVTKPKPFMDIVASYGIRPGVVARHAAQAVETLILAEEMFKWVDELVYLLSTGKTDIHNTSKWEPPDQAEGYGLTEAPRGALGHWIKVENGKIRNYQMVVPTTWNCSPRDDNGVRGPLEEALIGVPIPDPENPINVVRVIRSFDPCMACAVHILDHRNNKPREFQVA